MNDVGRFYIHKVTTVLSTNNVSGLNNVMRHVKDVPTLGVFGLTCGQIKLKLYLLLGKQNFKTTFEGFGEREISIPSLSAGVYLLQLQTREGKSINSAQDIKQSISANSRKEAKKTGNYDKYKALSYLESS